MATEKQIALLMKFELKFNLKTLTKQEASDMLSVEIESRKGQNAIRSCHCSGCHCEDFGYEDEPDMYY